MALSFSRFVFSLVPKLERSERPDEVCPQGGNGGCQQLAKRFGNANAALKLRFPLHSATIGQVVGRIVPLHCGRRKNGIRPQPSARRRTMEPSRRSEKKWSSARM